MVEPADLLTKPLKVVKPRRVMVLRRKRKITPIHELPRAKPQGAKRRERSDWKSVIREIALTSNGPVSYAEAREEIKKTKLAERLESSDKGFYGAIAKLNKAKEIVAYKGHIFAPAVFAKFKADLDAGWTKDLKIANAAHHSPMGEAIAKMMRSRPNGAESGHIIWELRKNSEFAEAIEKNKTHPYNVLARMLSKGELKKRGKRYYSPEVEAPPEPGGASKLFDELGNSSSRGVA